MEKRIQLKTRYHNRRTIDVFSSNCVNILLLVGFNVEPTEQPMKDFCIICNCKNTIGDKTVIRTPKTQSAIDLIMTNIPKSFQNWQAMKTGKSDFHKTSLVVLKFFYTRLKPNITQYRRYQKFSSDGFINGLQNIFFQLSSSWENCSFGNSHWRCSNKKGTRLQLFNNTFLQNTSERLPLFLWKFLKTVDIIP